MQVMKGMWEKNLDLGCIDLGCISDDKQTKNSSSAGEPHTVVDSIDSPSGSSKSAKNKSPKGSPPSGGNALTRVTSQIKKPAHRKTSPINWFPRKKVESYLKRKIKLLQEAGGMNNTLDETLGHSNPHYCRVLREKMAAKEAACKVMEARKAAMVEASWRRILQAARIPNKEADALVLKAEKEVTDAIEAAKTKGVIMYDTPDHPRKDFEIETSSVTGKGSTTHTVKASFETAFEVDKQVAAAVKAAFIKLTHCSSFSKDEFKDLLSKISENSDTHDLSEPGTGSEVEAVNCDEGSYSGWKNKKSSPQKFNGTKLVNMMLQRLKCLKEEELASLATIVATCGLNAALAETECQHRAHGKIGKTSMEYFMNGALRPKQVEPELPSLDKFLVKKLSKLEKEVQEARNARKAECNGESETKLDDSQKCSGDSEPVSADNAADMGSVLVKHSSKQEKEIEDGKRNWKSAEMDGPKLGTLKHSRSRYLKQDESEVPSLDKFLVKHVSKLEREVQEAKNRQKDSIYKGNQKEKENLDLNRSVPSEMQKNEKQSAGERVWEGSSLDEILLKPVHKLEREKTKAAQANESRDWSYKKQVKANDSELESLDKCLVKHVSKLQKEKLENAAKEMPEVKKRDTRKQVGTTVGGLDQVLVKHQSRLEREKSGTCQQPADGKSVSSQQPAEGKTYAMSRQEARDRELLESWGGLGLGNSMQPHVSRLQRDKTAWQKAEEEERQTVVQEL